MSFSSLLSCWWWWRWHCYCCFAAAADFLCGCGLYLMMQISEIFNQTVGKFASQRNYGWWKSRMSEWHHNHQRTFKLLRNLWRQFGCEFFFCFRRKRPTKGLWFTLREMKPQQKQKTEKRRRKRERKREKRSREGRKTKKWKNRQQ